MVGLGVKGTCTFGIRDAVGTVGYRYQHFAVGVVEAADVLSGAIVEERLSIDRQLIGGLGSVRYKRRFPLWLPDLCTLGTFATIIHTRRTANASGHAVALRG